MYIYICVIVISLHKPSRISYIRIRLISFYGLLRVRLAPKKKARPPVLLSSGSPSFSSAATACATSCSSCAAKACLGRRLQVLPRLFVPSFSLRLFRLRAFVLLRPACPGAILSAGRRRLSNFSLSSPGPATRRRSPKPKKQKQLNKGTLDASHHCQPSVSVVGNPFQGHAFPGDML